jgi:magnesium-transporting ATPase (P-type)
MTMLSSMIILFYSTSNLDDIQYGYTGAVLSSPLVIMICIMETSPKLVPELPFKSLINPSIFVSIIGQITINCGVQIACYFAVRGQSYFHPAEKGSDYTTDGFETTVVFLGSLPQYLYIGIIYSVFTNFRVPIYKNYIFLCTVAVQFLITYFMILEPVGFVRDWIQIEHLDRDFRYYLGGITVLNGMACFLFELLIVTFLGKSVSLQVPEKLQTEFTE